MTELKPVWPDEELVSVHSALGAFCGAFVVNKHEALLIEELNDKSRYSQFTIVSPKSYKIYGHEQRTI